MTETTPKANALALFLACRCAADALGLSTGDHKDGCACRPCRVRARLLAAVRDGGGERLLDEARAAADALTLEGPAGTARAAKRLRDAIAAATS